MNLRYRSTSCTYVCACVYVSTLLRRRRRQERHFARDARRREAWHCSGAVRCGSNLLRDDVYRLTATSLRTPWKWVVVRYRSGSLCLELRSPASGIPLRGARRDYPHDTIFGLHILLSSLLSSRLSSLLPRPCTHHWSREGNKSRAALARIMPLPFSAAHIRGSRFNRTRRRVLIGHSSDYQEFRSPSPPG